MTHPHSPLSPPGLNFLLSAGQTTGGLTLPAGTLPYVLVSSSTLSPYPRMANRGDANLNFNMSAMMSPACFVVGSAGPYAVAPEFNGVAVAPALSCPEQHRLFGSGPIPPHFPLESRPPLTFIQTETQVRQAGRQAGRQEDGQAGRKTGRMIGRQTDRQTISHGSDYSWKAVKSSHMMYDLLCSRQTLEMPPSNSIYHV